MLSELSIMSKMCMMGKLGMLSMMSTMSMMNTLSTLDMMSMHEHNEHDEHDERTELAEHHEHDEHAEHAVVGCTHAIAFRSIDSMNGFQPSCVLSALVSCIVYLHVHDCTIPDANKLYTDALSSYTCAQTQRPCYPNALASLSKVRVRAQHSHRFDGSRQRSARAHRGRRFVRSLLHALMRIAWALYGRFVCV